MTTAQTPSTRNEVWGFFGTMGADAPAAWPVAITAISAATGADCDEAASFLDSTHGRHFADGVRGRLAAGDALQQAVAAETERWMAWRIRRATARQLGIPVGMPYLTGFVVHEALLAGQYTAA